ncbi:hypothetical protein GRX03_16070 [Halovenus sp. WSH3]|uniref:Restriction endonuclease type IV Mrr domain-containing protein n=1 Tax=Halovenus carboxidivorans TaxID=2692199 RepID=A0A6B0TBU4_9EURY|nr:restriction endonuclease [Halovenus carboxidivorans]MXR53113.1 hypothetical protein [Halovenus carboxidivorans]
MGTIIDLTDGQDHEILERTEADGLFGGEYLDGRPLGEYLREGEQPKYVLRNKKSGVTVDDGRSLEPDSNFQAFALVTDLRVIFVVGQAGGDDSLSVRLPDIVGVSTESGLRSNTLVIETLADERWSFPSTGDPEPVAAYLEDATQVWANAARLLDDVEETLSRAEEAMASDEHEAAREHVDGARQTIDTAVHRISEVGPAAHQRIAGRAEELGSWLTDVERELAGGDGARAHAQAQTHWQRDEYEAAAESYDRAIESYREALDIDGSTPSTESLEERLRGAAAERELLRVGPLVDADTSRRRAVALADPEDAASEWERALDRYHDLLSLDWGDEGGQFVADREVIREQTTEIADDAVSDHYEAGRQWLRSGDKLAVQDRDKQATQVYERAAEQFEHAHTLASEIAPDRTETIETAITAAEDRLAGVRPERSVPDDPIGFEPEEEDDETETETDDSGDEMDDLSFHDSGSTATQVYEPSQTTATGSFGRENPGTESVLDRIQAQKQARAETGREGPTSAESESGDGTVVDTDPAAGSPDRLRERVKAVGTADLRDIVARLWERKGWKTSVVGAGGEVVYDVVAVDTETEERHLLWIIDADGGPVDRTVIRQCATTVEDGQGSDEAVVVTTGSVTPSAESEAENAPVSIVGLSELVDRLAESSVAGAVPSLEDGESPQT